jgi:hypothetical protein
MSDPYLRDNLYSLALDVARGYVEQGAYVVAFVNFLLALVQL